VALWKLSEPSLKPLPSQYLPVASCLIETSTRLTPEAGPSEPDLTGSELVPQMSPATVPQPAV
jgi:hypothetical protein